MSSRAVREGMSTLEKPMAETIAAHDSKRHYSGFDAPDRFVFNSKGGNLMLQVSKSHM